MAKRKPTPAGMHPPVISGQPMMGKIVRLIRAQNCGFIRTRERREAFFHRADTGETFSDMNVGDGVTFEWVDDKVSGPRAVRVRKV